MLWRLYLTHLKVRLHIMRSYGFNTVMQTLTLVVFFVFLYLGIRWVAAPQRFGDTLEAFMVGYWVWVGLLFSLSQFSWHIVGAAQQGLLEQVFMSPLRLRWMLAVEAAAGFTVDTAINLLLLVAFMALTGRWLHLEPVTTLTLYLLTLLPGFGLGYILAGLAMRFKNIQSAFNIVQFLMVPLQMLPVDRFPWLNLFPFAQGTRMLLQHARQGTLLWEFPAHFLLILLLQAGAYLLLGLVVYDRLELAARQRGLLSHY